MKLYVKLILLSIFLVSITCLPLYYFVSEEAELKLQEQIAARLSLQAENIVDDIDRFFYERKQDLALLAQENVLKNNDKDKILFRLKEVRAQNLLTASLSFFDTSRVRLVDTENNAIGKKHSDTKYWQLIGKDADVVSDVSYSESLGEIVLHFAGHVKDNDGKKLGVIVSRVLISRLYEIFSRDLNDPLLQKVHVDLIDDEQKLLYSNYNATGILKEKYLHPEILAFFEKETNKIYEANDSVYFLAKSKGYLNHEGNHWRVIISLPSDVAFLAIADLQNQMLLYMVIILFVAVALAATFARIISKPIVLLSHAAQDLGAGKLDVPIGFYSNDEIGNLAENFRIMAFNLKSTIEEQKSLNDKLNHSNDILANKFKKIEEQKLEIENKSAQLEKAFEEINRTSRAMTDSIKYAEKIQRSMLPEKELREEAFNESFIFFQPRDIVSGDFYWFDAVEKDGKKYFMVAAADCTGHGVPGGFMAMLGANLLNTIINIEKIIQPELVLNELNKDIKKALHQETYGENSHDGMEVALCAIDYENQKILFSGAGRPLVMFRNHEINVLSVEPFTVGGVDVFLKKKNIDFEGFKGYEVDFQKGDNLYLFSDGYKDQFGGEQNKKYSQKRFLEKLTSMQGMGMREQKNALEQEFLTWKGVHKQTDDVLVLGFTL